MHLHHLQGVSSFYFTNVTKIIKVKHPIESLYENVHMIIVDDKIQCTKLCELSTVIITLCGSCLLGGCIYNLDCLICVIMQ